MSATAAADLFVRDTRHGAANVLQTTLMLALNICNAVVLASGALLAAIIAIPMLVAAGIWGLVIVMTWRDMFGS